MTPPRTRRPAGDDRDITEVIRQARAAVWDGTETRWSGASGAGLDPDAIYGPRPDATTPAGRRP